MTTVTLDADQLHELAALIADELASRDELPELLDADQAATMIGLPASWLLREARAGRIPHHKRGHYVRFRRSELIPWLDERNTR